MLATIFSFWGLHLLCWRYYHAAVCWYVAPLRVHIILAAWLSLNVTACGKSSPRDVCPAAAVDSCCRTVLFKGIAGLCRTDTSKGSTDWCRTYSSSSSTASGNNATSKVHDGLGQVVQISQNQVASCVCKVIFGKRMTYWSKEFLLNGLYLILV